MLRVIVMVVGLFIIIVALSMVVVVKLVVLTKWSSNDSGGLCFLRHNAKISQHLFVKSEDITLHFNGKLLSISVLV